MCGRKTAITWHLSAFFLHVMAEDVYKYMGDDWQMFRFPCATSRGLMMKVEHPILFSGFSFPPRKRRMDQLDPWYTTALARGDGACLSQCVGLELGLGRALRQGRMTRKKK